MLTDTPHRRVDGYTTQHSAHTVLRQLTGLTDEDREGTVDCLLECDACGLALGEHFSNTVA